MELGWIKDYQALIGAAIVAIGWLVTGYLNRINNIALKRLDYRIKALESFFPIYNDIIEKKAVIIDDNFKEKHNQLVNNFMLYGYNDEIGLLDKFSFTINETPNEIENVKDAFKGLSSLVMDRARKELRII